MPDAPYVFISYASADRERVLPIIARIEAAGGQGLDRPGRHPRRGQLRARFINDAIQSSAAGLLLFASPASLASRNVKQELALAWRYEKSYVPLLLDTVTIPGDLAYWLEGSQWIEVLDRAGARVAERCRRGASAVRDHAADAACPEEERRDEERCPPWRGGIANWRLVRLASRPSSGDGAGSLILIGGEAGIGKTTLAEATLAAGLRSKNSRCSRAVVFDLAETPPFLGP